VSIVIVGAGGHGREVLDVAEACGRSCLGFLDDGEPDVALLAARGMTVLGPTTMSVDAELLIGVGSSRARADLARRLGSATTAPAVVHPTASVGSGVRLGAGSVLCAGVRLTTNITIGRHGYVGPNATIGHDAVIEDTVTVLPGAVLSGAVVAEEQVSVGAGAVVVQGVVLGAGCTVGAGAVVLRDVAPGVTVAGVPARPLG
jgi:sugar O-acyltransferase (sialic acid O-acetyltransferase NeuD family)